MRKTVEELWALLDARPEPEDGFMSHVGSPSECPEAPHRGPSGPNEDLAQCRRCMMPSWTMRPEGEQIGLHAEDCSLIRRHEGRCVGGGKGHAPTPKVRGYWGPSTEADIEAARARHI